MLTPGMISISLKRRFNTGANRVHPEPTSTVRTRQALSTMFRQHYNVMELLSSSVVRRTRYIAILTKSKAEWAMPPGFTCLCIQEEIRLD